MELSPTLLPSSPLLSISPPSPILSSFIPPPSFHLFPLLPSFFPLPPSPSLPLPPFPLPQCSGELNPNGSAHSQEQILAGGAGAGHESRGRPPQDQECCQEPDWRGPGTARESYGTGGTPSTGRGRQCISPGLFLTVRVNVYSNVHVCTCTCVQKEGSV